MPSSELPDDGGQQVAAALRRVTPGLQHLGVRQRLVADAGGEVGDQRDAEHLQAGLAGGDRLQRRGHADQVAAEDPGHLHLGRRLVVRAAELHVDALVEVGSTSRASVAQPRGVEVGEVDEVRALDRRGRREVEVVADQDRGAGRPVRVQPAAAVGQHDGPAARGGRGPDAVHDGADAVALVEVGAGAVDQGPPSGVADGDRAA